MVVHLLSPTPLSGIGQVVSKYSKLLNGKIIYVDDDSVDLTGKEVFAFALPIQMWIDKLKKVKEIAKNVVCMTVCETENVHPAYGELFALFKNFIVPSEFCKSVFSRQYPKNRFFVVRHWEPLPRPCMSRLCAPKYVFYHIGNIIDHRKQVNKIVSAFTELNLPGTQLVLKATCKQPVKLKMPNVLVINGLLDNEQMDRIHNSCDCYVSFSHSEGVGMGAVEAALRDKPVILSEYGGAKEYIKSEYTIPCKMTTVGCNDFLYTPYMLWGDPDYNSLKSFMTEVYEKRVRSVNHEYTRILLEPETIRNQLSELLSGQIDPRSGFLGLESSAEKLEELPYHQQDQSPWVLL